MTNLNEKTSTIMSTSITLNCVYNLYAEHYILKQCLTDDTLPQCLVQQINILIWFFWNYLLFWPTLWVLKGLSASRLLVHTQIQKHKRHRAKQVQWISSRSEVMMKMEVFFSSAMALKPSTYQQAMILWQKQSQAIENVPLIRKWQHGEIYKRF